MDAAPRQESHQEQRILPEAHSIEFGGIHNEDGKSFAVTGDAEGIVEVSPELANTIDLALRVQKKVFSGKYPRLSRLFQSINCRKTVFTATGKLSIAEATKAKEDISAVEPLFEDVQRLQRLGYLPHVIDDVQKELRGIIDQYDQDYPCVVHLFEVDIDSSKEALLDLDLEGNNGAVSPEIVSHLHRFHSFLVLGKGKSDYVCFQKVAANLNPFTVSHLEDVMMLDDANPTRKTVAFVGPAA